MNRSAALKSGRNAPVTLAFTGERVIPGAVEPQLWNEHISRYHFARLFAEDRTVLDVGSGAGYGTDLLAQTARAAVGIDISVDTVQYAQATYPAAAYVCASASAVPFPARSFQLITAFEVIEHLVDWEQMLDETARLLTDDGVFLVSTPNRSYYNESRGVAGPNPYHVHEFHLDEFRDVLNRRFPFVQMLGQNQQENITITGETPASATAAVVPPTQDLANSHFFVAVCSRRPLGVPFFADVSSTHNLLRDRERHIRGLQGELAAAHAQYSGLLSSYSALTQELEQTRVAYQELVEAVGQARNCIWIRVGRALGVGPWTDQHTGLMKRLRGVLSTSRPKPHVPTIEKPRLESFGDRPIPARAIRAANSGK